MNFTKIKVVQGVTALVKHAFEASICCLGRKVPVRPSYMQHQRPSEASKGYFKQLLYQGHEEANIYVEDNSHPAILSHF